MANVAYTSPTEKHLICFLNIKIKQYFIISIRSPQNKLYQNCPRGNCEDPKDHPHIYNNHSEPVFFISIRINTCDYFHILMLQEQLKFWGRQQNFGTLYQIDYSYSFIVEHSSPQENVLLKTGNLV